MKSAARRSSVRAALVGAVLACGGASVLAQAPANGFPSKTVRIISAFPAGSGPDAALRLVAEQLARKWGQPVVVDNRPGGNGFIAINAIKQSPTDGLILPPYSRPRPIRNKAPGPSRAPGTPGRPAAA
jgi:tripartite-type tricarboxylate transporter receptor subunit TctC